MYEKSGHGRHIEKVKVTRINNLFIMPNTESFSRNKIIKNYVYSPQVRIIA